MVSVSKSLTGSVGCNPARSRHDDCFERPLEHGKLAQSVGLGFDLALGVRHQPQAIVDRQLAQDLGRFRKQHRPSVDGRPVLFLPALEGRVLTFLSQCIEYRLPDGNARELGAIVKGLAYPR